MSDDDKSLIQKAADKVSDVMKDIANPPAKIIDHVDRFNDISLVEQNLDVPPNSVAKKVDNSECSCELKKVRPVSEFMHVKQINPTLEYFCCDDNRECIMKMNTALAASRPKETDAESKST